MEKAREPAVVSGDSTGSESEDEKVTVVEKDSWDVAIRGNKISITALVLSLIGCWFSYQANQSSKKANDLSTAANKIAKDSLLVSTKGLELENAKRDEVLKPLVVGSFGKEKIVLTTTIGGGEILNVSFDTHLWPFYPTRSRALPLEINLNRGGVLQKMFDELSAIKEQNPGPETLQFSLPVVVDVSFAAFGEVHIDKSLYVISGFFRDVQGDDSITRNEISFFDMSLAERLDKTMRDEHSFKQKEKMKAYWDKCKSSLQMQIINLDPAYRRNQNTIACKLENHDQ